MATTSSSSQNSGSSQSQSTPTVVNTPTSDWLLQLSHLLEQVGSQTYDWAMQQFAHTSQITEAQIQNYVNMAQQGSDLASNTLGRYQSIYSPLADQYARDAGNYASTGRLQHNMGAAQSRAMQAGKQGLINAETELQSYGIDPSSGRYQDLVRASNTANAASAAAAGETARRETEATGRQMKENAISIGQQLPGATVNALNSAYQGIGGAANTALGTANTGANLLAAAAPYYNTAMGAKLPPIGQNSTSQSMQSGWSNSSSSSPGGGSRKSDPFNSDRFGRGSGGGGSRGGGGGGGVPPAFGARPLSGGSRNIRAPNADIIGGLGGGAGGFDDPYNYDVGNWDADWGSGTNGFDDPYNYDVGNWDADWGGNYSDPAGWGGGNYGSWGGDYSDPAGWGGGNYGSWGGDYGGSSPSWSGYSASNYSGGYSAGNYGGGWGSDYSGSSYSGGGSYDYNSGGGYYGGGWYAQGGGVLPSGGKRQQGKRPQGQRPPQGGGRVPRQMSPSGGQQVDDVQAVIPQTGGQAQLNVDEFVIPRDVAMWKGQEFFQKLIAQSRQARTGAPAKPSKSPPSQGAQNAQRMA